jgi:hypothetical protein
MFEMAQRIEESAPAPPDGQPEEPLIRFALALMRQRVAPALQEGWPENDPVHIAMLGATNSGKSTVLNVFLGAPAAGMHYQARFSQHPEGFRLAAMGSGFLDEFPSRFEGYQRYIDQRPPRQPDHELRRAADYRPALALHDPARYAPDSQLAASEAVWWDVPDFSTQEAQAYLRAVLDTVALADLVVLVVTKQNYADLRTKIYRSMVSRAGVPVWIVANLMEAEDTGLLADIRRKMSDDDEPGGRIPGDRVFLLPHIAGEDEIGRFQQLLASPEADAFRAAIGKQARRGRGLKLESLRGAVACLENRLEAITRPLAGEIAVVREWEDMLERVSRTEFFEPYRADYLQGEKYGEFNRTVVKLMELLQIPGIGQVVSAAAGVVKDVAVFIRKAAMAGVRAIFGMQKKEPEKKQPAEVDIVIECFQRWLKALKAEAQRKAQTGEHAAWAALAQSLGSQQYFEELSAQLAPTYQAYQRRMEGIIAARAQAMFAAIEKNPALLNSLRGLNVGVQIATTTMIILSHGLDWTDYVVGPLVAPVLHLIVEFGVGQVVEIEKKKLKEQQFQALRDVVEKDMIAPTRALFRSEVKSEDVEGLRADLVIVREALQNPARN